TKPLGQQRAALLHPGRRAGGGGVVNRSLIVFLAVFLGAQAAEAKPWRAAMSPGDVAKAHEPFEDKCENCHLVYNGVPDAKCDDCHEGLRLRIDKSEGVHATVKSKPCLDCHTDHKGRTASMTRDTSKKEFDHGKTGFALAGAHEKATCQKCHDRPIEQVKPA